MSTLEYDRVLQLLAEARGRPAPLCQVRASCVTRLEAQGVIEWAESGGGWVRSEQWHPALLEAIEEASWEMEARDIAGVCGMAVGSVLTATHGTGQITIEGRNRAAKALVATLDELIEGAIVRLFEGVDDVAV